MKIKWSEDIKNAYLVKNSKYILVSHPFLSLFVLSNHPFPIIGSFFFFTSELHFFNIHLAFDILHF